MDSKLLTIMQTMEEYLEAAGYGCGYSKKSINKFQKISTKFLNNIKKCKNENDFEKASIKYIKKLNLLNSKCDYELIETDQRELIVDMIFDVGAKHNFMFEDDFTDIHREW